MKHQCESINWGSSPQPRHGPAWYRQPLGIQGNTNPATPARGGKTTCKQIYNLKESLHYSEGGRLFASSHEKPRRWVASQCQPTGQARTCLEQLCHSPVFSLSEAVRSATARISVIPADSKALTHCEHTS